MLLLFDNDIYIEYYFVCLIPFYCKLDVPPANIIFEARTNFSSTFVCFGGMAILTAYWEYEGAHAGSWLAGGIHSGLSGIGAIKICFAPSFLPFFSIISLKFLSRNSKQAYSKLLGSIVYYLSPFF